jgi:hypothetical protein
MSDNGHEKNKYPMSLLYQLCSQEKLEEALSLLTTKGGTPTNNVCEIVLTIPFPLPVFDTFRDDISKAMESLVHTSWDWVDSMRLNALNGAQETLLGLYQVTSKNTTHTTLSMQRLFA